MDSENAPCIKYFTNTPLRRNLEKDDKKEHCLTNQKLYTGCLSF